MLKHPNSEQDTDSSSSREKAYKKFSRFLKHISFENLSQTDKAELLQKISFDEFMNFLSVTNGLLTQRDKFQKWEGKISGAYVSIGGGSEEDADLEPPNNADQEFKKLFEAIKINGHETDLAKNAIKLYTAVIFSHMFPDGNGRLARNLYALMTQNNAPNKDISLGRNKQTMEFALIVSSSATMNLFKKAGIQEKYDEYYTTKNGISIGSMDHLKYLAIKRVLERKKKWKEEGERRKQFELNDLNDSEIVDYKKEYEQVKKELFWETQNVVDEYHEWAKEKLDEITTKEVIS